MKQVELFCDGSSLGNPGAGGYCGILKFGQHEKIIGGGEKMTTNNRMELRGVIESLKYLKEPCEIILCSDSKYVCNGISEWLEKWVKKDFAQIKNSDLWKEFLEVSKPHTIKTHWIKGHSGHIQNERCDKIAKDWAMKYKQDSKNDTLVNKLKNNQTNDKKSK